MSLGRTRCWARSESLELGEKDIKRAAYAGLKAVGIIRSLSLRTKTITENIQ